MDLDGDPKKQAKTFSERGLDFADAAVILAGRTLSAEDNRRDYGEVRIITVGFLRGRMMIVVWTDRGGKRRIISMRKANEREQRRYQKRFGEE